MNSPSPPLWTSRMIAEATSGTCEGAWDVHGLSIDSRTLKPDDLFIPLKGPSFDGHDYIGEALARGAAGALAERAIADAPPDRLIRVADTFRALQDLGHAGRARSRAKILAVTGSAGKTGCKEALRQILARDGVAYANEGSFNNHWGVPLSLARLPQAAQYGVFEIGMNHAGELGPLSVMVRPHIALITNIASVHIGNFESLDGIAAAKAEIFKGLAADGHAVIGADGPYAGFLAQRAAEAGVNAIHRFGRADGAEARLLASTLQADGSMVEADIRGTRLTYYIGAPGEHWVMNSLAVLLCAGLAGVGLHQAAASLRELKLAKGRGGARSIAFAKGRFTLIDESYNASPVAVEMAIRVLAKKQPQGNGRRVLVLGDMRELGVSARDAHLALAPVIMDAGIAKVFCVGELAKHLFEALPAALQGAYGFTSAELAPQVAAAVADGDIITVKGSYSMMMDKVVAALDALQNQTHGRKAGAA